MIEVAVLEKSDAVGEFVALKTAVIERSRKGESLCHAGIVSTRDLRGVNENLSRVDGIAVDVDDSAGFIEEERCGKRQIPAAVEKVAIKDVVNASGVGRAQKKRDVEVLVGLEIAKLREIEIIIQIDASEVDSFCGEVDVGPLQGFQ